MFRTDLAHLHGKASFFPLTDSVGNRLGLNKETLG